MLGAIIGDIAGSRFEFKNLKSKKFDLFTNQCCATDDSKMTLAVAKALLISEGNWSVLSSSALSSMRDIGRRYPGGYGGSFQEWLFSDDPHPYNSWGNGAAMRVSPCAWAATSLEEALNLSDRVTIITHNHPEGMKGARAVTAAIYLAREEKSIEEIKTHIQQNYYPLDFTLKEIRPTYKFDVSCQGSVPQAIEAFLESTSFEDAIRNAISIGGDSDTIAAIAGSIAEAYYGIPESLRVAALSYLDDELSQLLLSFESIYGTVADKTPQKAKHKSKDIVYKNVDSLKPVAKLVEEASEGLNDPSRTIANSPINELLAGAMGAGIGAGIGGAASFAALYGLGQVGLSAVGISTALKAAGALIGGGMAAGIGVLAIPVAALSAAGVGVAAHLQGQQLQHEKERLYAEALRKHDAIIKELEKKATMDQERIEYLTSLNLLLQKAIFDLRGDLGVTDA